MKLHSSALRLAQRLFLWLGAAALAYFVGTATYAGLYQRYENWKFEHQQFDIPEYIKPDTMGTSVDVTKATLLAGMRFPEELCDYRSRLTKCAAFKLQTAIRG